ncbi:hypothetical protein IMSAGC019_00926 [Lachnospiraceae bacterium]|nr:hypothetical protein IMSAGC019_00926 [Lachnospiraceae bacterium]
MDPARIGLYYQGFAACIGKNIMHMHFLPKYFLLCKIDPGQRRRHFLHGSALPQQITCKEAGMYINPAPAWVGVIYGIFRELQKSPHKPALIDPIHNHWCLQPCNSHSQMGIFYHCHRITVLADLCFHPPSPGDHCDLIAIQIAKLVVSPSKQMLSIQCLPCKTTTARYHFSS